MSDPDDLDERVRTMQGDTRCGITLSSEEAEKILAAIRARRLAVEEIKTSCCSHDWENKGFVVVDRIRGTRGRPQYCKMCGAERSLVEAIVADPSGGKQHG